MDGSGGAGEVFYLKFIAHDIFPGEFLQIEALAFLQLVVAAEYLAALSGDADLHGGLIPYLVAQRLEIGLSLLGSFDLRPGPAGRQGFGGVGGAQQQQHPGNQHDQAAQRRQKPALMDLCGHQKHMDPSCTVDSLDGKGYSAGGQNRTEEQMERLDKFLTEAGVGTRSQVKQILKTGRVAVDGKAVKDGALKFDRDTQRVTLDGRTLGGKRRMVLLLNKPAGFVTATEDPRDRTVMELLPPELRNQELKPVGRLDKATEGLLLFTNDGDLLHRLISPRKGVEKIYYARHEGTASEADIRAFAEGLTLRDGTECLPAKLEPLGDGESLVTVCEGKYHQVRRMMASRGMTVRYLERRQEGSLCLGDLPRGSTRELTAEELAALEEMAD